VSKYIHHCQTENGSKTGVVTAAQGHISKHDLTTSELHGISFILNHFLLMLQFLNQARPQLNLLLLCHHISHNSMRQLLKNGMAGNVKKPQLMVHLLLPMTVQLANSDNMQQTD